MIQINLLPVRNKKKRETARQFVSVYVLSTFLLLIAMGFLWNSKKREIEALDRRLSQIRQEVNQYAKFEVMLKELKSRKELVDRKREVISNLQKDRDTIVRILAMLSVQVPGDKMWFERFTQSANTITLNGMALSNEAIADFMRNLESSPYVEKGTVNLAHSRQSVVNNMKLREFQVTYRFFPFSKVQEQAESKGP